MRTSIMAACIILCFTLTFIGILTVNSYSNAKLAATTNLNASVDSVMHALQSDNAFNGGNYEKMIGVLMQNIILQTDPNGDLNIKILNANTEEGLVDVEITKQFIWLGIKKDIVTRRTVILDEYETPASLDITVFFKYKNEDMEMITWREESTFVGAIIQRPKQPKKTGCKFVGWSLTEDGDIISDETWQNYIVPDVSSNPKNLTFYAVFESKST